MATSELLNSSLCCALSIASLSYWLCWLSFLFVFFSLVVSDLRNSLRMYCFVMYTLKKLPSEMDLLLLCLCYVCIFSCFLD